MKTVVQGSLITTFRCNAKCNMCNIWQHQTKPEEEIDYHYYEKLPAGSGSTLQAESRRSVKTSTTYSGYYIPRLPCWS